MSASVDTSRAPRRSGLARFEPLLWVGPALLLILLVVIWPVGVMIMTSFQRITADGFIRGWAGWRNYVNLWREPELGAILLRTVIWVVVSVMLTMLISLGIAQLFNQRFPGRRIARWALIAPWAASVMMTAIIFRWALNADFGVVNIFLNDIGLLDGYNTTAADWLGQPMKAMPWMILVAVFVSVPFSTYALLAGLQGIPDDLYEAARMDGAGWWQRYTEITLPMLKPSFVVALLINIMNVFNSFPIIWVMTRGGPGRETSTTTVFMYQLKQSYIGESAAMSVVNFGLVALMVAVYLRFTLARKETSR